MLRDELTRYELRFDIKMYNHQNAIYIEIIKSLECDLCTGNDDILAVNTNGNHNLDSFLVKRFQSILLGVEVK